MRPVQRLAFERRIIVVGVVPSARVENPSSAVLGVLPTADNGRPLVMNRPLKRS